MPSALTQNIPGRAIALKLGAVFLFMVMAALIKAASGSVPPGQAVFFRSLFAIPVIGLWLWQQGHLHDGLYVNKLLGHVWRGLFGTTAMGLTFAGLALLPLPEVTAIGYATPMFTVLFAAIFLGEKVRLFRLSAVALGLIGVMIVLAPRLSIGADVGTAATLGAIMVLVASILRAWSKYMCGVWYKPIPPRPLSFTSPLLRPAYPYLHYLWDGYFPCHHWLGHPPAATSWP